MLSHGGPGSWAVLAEDQPVIMKPGTTRIQQVKVPVTDLHRSVAWYRALLGLDLMREFVEDGLLCGATLVNRESGFLIGLRLREAVPGQPSFPGFDLFSLGVSALADLHELTTRCDALGIAHGELVDRGTDGVHLDVPDPDGTVVRFLSPFAADGPAFSGAEFHADGTVTFYDQPRLPT